MTTDIGPQDNQDDTQDPGHVAQPSGNDTTTTRLEFDGDWRELLPIALINILLTIVTLGIYRFWARTRVRRFLWSRLRLDGDAFEYTGTGLELFLGFLIVVFVVLLPMAGLGYYYSLALQSGDVTGALISIAILYIAFIALSGAAFYRAWRYRLSRTLWRGIRGFQEEKGWKFAGKYLLWFLGTVVSFGFATPYMMNQVWGYPTNRRWFGSGRFAYTGTSGPLFGRFFACIGLTFAAIFGIFIIVTVFGAIAAGIGFAVGGFSDQASMEQTAAGITVGIIVGIIIYLVIALVYAAIWLWFQQAYYQHIARHTTYEGVAFEFDIRFGPLFKLAVGNIFIYILTLGLGADFVTLRKMRFMAENLVLQGAPDWNSIQQVPGDLPGVGEGLAEAFDVGGFKTSPPGAIPGAYFDGDSATRHDVLARPQPIGLMIEGPSLASSQMLWQWAEILLLDSNRDGSRVVLRRDGDDGPRLTLDSPDTRTTLARYAPQLGGPRHGEGHWRAIKIAGGIAAVLAVAIFAAPYVARGLAPLIPKSALNALGWETVDSIANMGGGYCETPEGRAAVEHMTARVLGDTALPQPLKVHIVDHVMVNAFAAPGGHVVIMNGLILKAESPDEVAGVLAHEIGHVKHRHAEQNLVNAFGLEFLIGAMIGGNVGETAHLLMRLSHSRDAEREADAEGIRMLENAKLATGGFAAFFERLQSEEEAREKQIAEARKKAGREPEERNAVFESLGSILTGAGTLLSTHPPTEERIARAKESANGITHPIVTDEEWQAIKIMCRESRNADDDKETEKTGKVGTQI